MKAKKNRYGIVLSVTVLLFFMGVAKLLTMTAAQQEEGTSPSSSISGSRPQPDSSADKGKKILPDGTAGEETEPPSKDSPGSNGEAQNSDTKMQEKKKVALTFDDGPDSEYTPMLLDGLAERNVKATFFVIGKQAEAQPEIMQRLVKEGHLIGNHTYNHVDIRHMTESSAEEEILKANEVIEKYTGEEPCFLRPPFGSGSSSLEKKIEMIPVLWTIDTMDWACQNESKICTTVYREIQENSIILMHDEYPTTVRAALRVIDKLQKEGYEFVTVDKIVMD